MIWQFIINGLITGLLYSLLAIGFALVYNTTHIFHIAAAGIYVFAAYMFWWVSQSLPIVPSIFVSLVLAAILSLLIDKSVYSPLQNKGASRNRLLIASIGLMIVLVNGVALVFGTSSKSIAKPFPAVLSMGPVSITTLQLAQVIIAVISISALLVFLDKSHLGVCIRAFGDDRDLYCILGKKEPAVRLFVFTLSGLFIALASNLTVMEVGMQTSMGMMALVNALVAMIIGGTGKYHTCLLGGLTLGIVQSLVMSFTNSQWQMAVSFMILLAFLFLRPQGIAGIKPREV